MKKTSILSVLMSLMLMLTLIFPLTVSALELTDAKYEEGVSAADDIVKTEAADKVILVVSFGTSFNHSRAFDIGGIEAAIAEQYPDYQVRRAFTSQIIIDKLVARDDLQIDNVTDAMNRLVLDKVSEVIVQPTTVLNGYEYDDIISEIEPFTDKFESLKLGAYLLASDDDFSEVASIIVDVTSDFRAEKTAIVYMGHGTEHAANAIYAKLQTVLKDEGFDDYVIGNVEHTPTMDDVLSELEAMDVEKVILRPLMIVAGDHANNDMASDEEDSWKSILEAKGYTVETVLEGLGSVAAIQDIFTRHVEEAMASENLGVDPIEPIGLTANRIADGEYELKATTDSAMFKIVAAKVNVDADQITAEITLSGSGFASLYEGQAEDALNQPDDIIEPELVDDKHVFKIPVAALDKPLSFAAKGTKSGNWFDHEIVIESATLPSEAILEKEIEVALIGGTGRATIESPTSITYDAGQNIATITWSSSNYTYMVVDGEEYQPVNTEGNSTFKIPVRLDQEMKVIANTVAMSSPKEIEYTLYFDQETIR